MIEDRLSALATEKLLTKKEGKMLINKIKGLKLKKPIEVTVEKLFTVECKELNMSGAGVTKKAAIENFKFGVIDLYEDFQMIDETNDVREYEEAFMEYFE